MIKKIKKTKSLFLPLVAIIFVIGGTILLVAFAQGYTFDPASRKISTTGLVLIDSSPNDAFITLNNKFLNKKTPFRYAGLPAGDITISLKKDQYRSWFSKQKVVAGEVTFANYALLLPEVLYQESITAAGEYSQVLQSSSLNRTLALSKDSLTIYSLNNDGENKLIYRPVVPAEATKVVIGLEKLQVSANGERALFTQVLASGERQSVFLHTGDGKFDNLTVEYGFVFSDLRFNPADSNELFWLDAGVLKKIKVSEKSISSNLISSVASLAVTADRLLVVAQPDISQASLVPTAQVQKLSSYSFSGTDEKEIAKVTAGTAGFQMGYIKSRYNDYVSVIHSGSGLLELIRDPYADGGQSKTSRYDGVKQISVSPNSRFVVLDQLDTMHTLDLEYDRQYDSQASTVKLQSLAWLDSYHLVLLQDSQLRLVDFDGQNNQLLTPNKDVASTSISTGSKTLMPLNSAGELFKLWLVKK